MISYNDSLCVMETDTQEIFVEGIKKILSDINKGRKRSGKKKLTIDEISEGIGVAANNLSGFLNYHRNYSEAKRIDLARFFNKTYIEVLDIGRQVLSKDGDLSCAFPVFDFQATATHTHAPVIDFQDEADKRHAAVIAGFEDKEKAVEINEKLVELEKLDGTDGLKAASTYIDFLINQAREKKGLPPLKNGTNPNP
jgi:hypothetical protein